MSLKKSLYATSPQVMAAVCTDVYQKSQAAQAAIGQLPVDEYDLEETASFITRVGDYAFTLSKSSAAGSEVTDEEAENLSSLSDAAAMLSYNLNQFQAQVNGGTMTVSALQALGSSDEDLSALGDSFKNLESEFPEVPSLIYDGPFSEHITEGTPKLTEGAAEVSEAEALSICAEFFGVRESVFELSYEREGKIPVYAFAAQVDGGTLYCEVTKKGGHICSAMNSRAVSSQNITAEEGVSIATEFLISRGIEDMKESYYIIEENTMLINFAYTQNGVVCYPDLVKVSVSMDTGSIVGFESAGYIMNHVERDIPQPSVSEDEAIVHVSDKLSVISSGLAVIPTDGQYEKFCYEFTCEDEDGSHYIVYVGAESGVMEKILVLIEDENGTLRV